MRPRTHPRTPVPRPAALAAACAGAAAVALAFAGTATAIRDVVPVTEGGRYDDPRVGTLDLRWHQRRISPTGSAVVVMTTRGSVRLPAGRWCVVTTLLPGDAKRVARSTVAALDAPGVVRIPRFTKRNVGKVLFGHREFDLARVRVLTGSCSGGEHARGSVGYYWG